MGSLNSSFVTKTFPLFLQVPTRLPAGFGSIPNSIKPRVRCVLPVFHAFPHKQHSCFEMLSLAGAQQHSNKAGNGERVQLVLYYFFQLNTNSQNQYLAWSNAVCILSVYFSFDTTRLVLTCFSQEKQIRHWLQCFLLQYFSDIFAVVCRSSGPVCIFFGYSWVCLDVCAFLHFRKVNSNALGGLNLAYEHEGRKWWWRKSLLVWILREWKLFALSLWLLDFVGRLPDDSQLGLRSLGKTS